MEPGYHLLELEPQDGWRVRGVFFFVWLKIKLTENTDPLMHRNTQSRMYIAYLVKNES